MSTSPAPGGPAAGGAAIGVGPVRRDPVTAEFFDAAARGVFLIRRCGRCQTATEPQARACPACGSPELSSEPASGGARVISWSVTHGWPGGDDPVATVLVIAELDEGPWWWSQLVDADPGAVHEGQRLRIDFARSGEPDRESVPVFRVQAAAPAD